LYEFLKGDMNHFRPFIEHCKSCTGAFLRGFFDGEGSSSRGHVTAYNGDLQLLKYVRLLLRKTFAIRSTGPHITGPPPGGTIMIKGKFYRVNRPHAHIYICGQDTTKFAETIGFSILRKQRNLAV
ncbi:MAG: hypothetical protein E6K86_10025, partial [Thaumarchaeota archaeon]